MAGDFQATITHIHNNEGELAFYNFLRDPYEWEVMQRLEDNGTIFS